jgi:hypothetical protein
MKTVRTNNVIVTTLVGLLAFGVWLTSVELPFADAGAKQQKGISQNALSNKLLKLDSEAREKFEKTHPGVLPEGPIRARLPLPSAKHFNWCDLNQDFYVHNQGRSGSCWANSAIEALECSWLIRNGVRHQFSPQPILDYTRRDKGGNAGIAFDVLLKHGTAFISQYDFIGHPGEIRKNIPTKYRAVAWGQVGDKKGPATVRQLKEALLEHGPLVVNLFSTKAFKKYTSGVFAEHYQPGKEEPKHNHEVLLLGWDDKRGRGAWYIKNSWGKKWGEGGYGWIEYGCNNICYNAWWVTAQSTYYKLPKDAFLRLVPDADAPMAWNSPIAPSAAVTAVRQKQNVERNGKKGIVFNVTAEIGKAKLKKSYITLFIESNDGKPLTTTNKEYATTEGHLRVRKEIVSTDDHFSLKDVELFLPYSLLPGGAGKNDYRFHVNIWHDGKWLCRGNVYSGAFSVNSTGAHKSKDK